MLTREASVRSLSFFFSKLSHNGRFSATMTIFTGFPNLECPPFPGDEFLTGSMPPDPVPMFPNHENGRDRMKGRRGFGRQTGQG